MTKTFLNRREFLKLGGLALGGAVLRGFPPGECAGEYEHNGGLIGRVTVDRQAAIYTEPRFHSGVVRWTRQDELLNLYYLVTPPEGPAYNPVWYRVWGGFVHSGWVQLVEFHCNQPLSAVPASGQLAEITVPYSQAYQFTSADGWQPGYRLYYETTHWITDVVEGPDGEPWYQLTSELTDYLIYYVRARHLRPIPDEEIAPISPHLPYEAKRIEVSLQDQMLTAYEEDTPVFWARISSGLKGREVPAGTQTPRGRFHVTSKSPSKHMGAVAASGAPAEYVLPGVPWTSFFVFESGVAFHGTFWHNNFGLPMSHGCINMRNADAKWLFRWATPVFDLPVKDRSGWDARGYGTQVLVL